MPSYFAEIVLDQFQYKFNDFGGEYVAIWVYYALLQYKVREYVTILCYTTI